MKRSIAVLILALALALTACGGQKAADAQAEAKDITLCPTYDNGKGGYFSITLPASWGDHYVTECGANDGGYYVGFYERTDHDNGLGGFLFMLEVFPTDYDYTERSTGRTTTSLPSCRRMCSSPTKMRIFTAACPTIFRPSSRA